MKPWEVVFLTVYVDVLFLVNVYVDYFILLSVKNFLKLDTKTLRIVLASVLGGVFSLTSLFGFSPVVNHSLSLIFSVLICLTAFGYGFLLKFIKTTACFYSFGFIFSGFILALVNIFGIKGTTLVGNEVYFDISILFLFLFTMLAYFTSLLIDKVKGRKENSFNFCTLVVRHGGKTLTLKAKVDTANNLREPFSGIGVIVAQKTSLVKILPESEDFLPEKFRLVPFNSLGGKGLLPAFLPDNLEIIKYKKKAQVKFYIAIYENPLSFGAYDCLIGEEVFEKIDIRGEVYENSKLF